MSGIGANDNMARIDFQSRHSLSQALSNGERIAEKKLGSDGISLEDTMLIESMSVNKSESDAIVKRASNVSDVRCVKLTDHESVAGRVSVFNTGTTVTRSEVGGVVKSDGSIMGKGRFDLSKTVRSNVGEDMSDQSRTKLKAGNDMKIVHSKSKCGNFKGEVSIRCPSSDGSAGRIGRAHFESGSDV